MKTLEEKREAQRQANARFNAKNPGAAAMATREWRKRHPEYSAVHAARQLQYASQNREQEKARAAKWRAENPEKDRKMKRASYQKNRKERIAGTRSYAQRHPEKVRAWRADRDARKRSVKGKISPERVAVLFQEQNGQCNACRCDLLQSGKHLDHIIPLSRGGPHCDDNVQLLCPTCNRRKSAKDFATFLAELERDNAGL